jgi:cyanate permease
VALGVVVDKPSHAHWLTEREKQLVLADLEADGRQTGPRKHGLGEALKLPQLWLVTMIYFCATSSHSTIGFWIPSIIQSLGVKSSFNIGLLSAIPSIVAVIGMVLVSQHSDHTRERRYHSAIPFLVCGLGLIGIGVFTTPTLAFTALVLAVAGPLSGFPAFWEMPRALLAGTAAAGGIALINSIGMLSGWLGPSVVGWLVDITGKTATGLYVVAGLEILGAVLILLFVPRRAVVTRKTTPK